MVFDSYTYIETSEEECLALEEEYITLLSQKMNKTFNDVTVLGKIIFPDGVELNGSSLQGINNIQSFERNALMGTTFLLPRMPILSQKNFFLWRLMEQ